MNSSIFIVMLSTVGIIIISSLADNIEHSVDLMNILSKITTLYAFYKFLSKIYKFLFFYFCKYQPVCPKMRFSHSFKKYWYAAVFAGTSEKVTLYAFS
jgi:hypothetical protein